MRKFEVCCTDQKTGFQIILSECSYNHACSWLYTELKKNGYEVLDARVLSNGMTRIRTVKDGMQGRMFLYDEERGYLMAE